ncbi:class III lanthionine synthetase LanKC [Micromonospora sp. NPDC007208]|uniref:class III lanthionine synthetase LanKC n=1 Tax=Micromonospora sp. NPDC007208 TaxID=3364236 RepID=UPI0036CB2FC3
MRKGTLFYDDPFSEQEEDDLFPATLRSTPYGWERASNGPWIVLTPKGEVLPEQGWKIHVSAAESQAIAALDVVWSYCEKESIPFKFLRSARVSRLINSKYAARSSSGKFITIYPKDASVLERALETLGKELEGIPGPYVLNDLRWGNGPLYIRYGAFTELYCNDEDGARVPAMRRPDGVLVPDRRDLLFTTPSWVNPPDIVLREISDAELREANSEDDFPFQIEDALHISNAGGLYLATDERNGRRVLLREARPYAGLDARGQDAVTRLLHERDTLQRIAGVNWAPELYEHRLGWEHHFLVEEYIEGQNLDREITRRYPLARVGPSDAYIEEYTTWALDVIAQVTAIIEHLHLLGIVFADLHPANIMVRPDGVITLVDFELSFSVDDESPPPLGAAGFISPAARKGVAVDLYALACLRLHIFLPLQVLISMDNTKAELISRSIDSIFPTPASYTKETLALLERASGGSLTLGGAEPSGLSTVHWPERDRPETNWREVLDSLARGVLAAATPERRDRLFPGDAAQFKGMGGLDLSHGAAGTLFAMSAIGQEVDPRHVQWLVDRVAEFRSPLCGFYDGLHGIAWSLHALGYQDRARAVLERASGLENNVATADLSIGLSGIALNLLFLGNAYEDLQLLARAEQISLRLRDAFKVGGKGSQTGIFLPKMPGLTSGAAGAALLFVRMFEATADPEWLDVAGIALRQDLDMAKEEDGLLQLPDGNGRLLPYLGQGTVGLALVVRQYLKYREDSDLRRILDSADKISMIDFVYAPGLFEGRSSMIYYLGVRAHDNPAPDTSTVRMQLNKLARHAMYHRGELIFPGRRLLRLSTDLATGSAGVALSVNFAVNHGPQLPFLGDSR